MAIPSGWTESSGTKYKTTMPQRLFGDPDNQGKWQRLVIEGDYVTGDFSIKVRIPGAVERYTTLYEYDANTNRSSIVDSTAYNKFYSTSGGETQLKNTNRAARRALYEIAKHNVAAGKSSGIYGPVATVPDGYKSFNNDSAEDSNNSGSEDENDNNNNNDKGTDPDAPAIKVNWDDIWGWIGDWETVGGTKHAVYRYPYNSNELAEFGYDFIQITAYDYVTSFGPDFAVTNDYVTLQDYVVGSAFDNNGVPTFEQAGDSSTQTGLLPPRSIFRRGEERFAKQRWETIQLPMQPKIQEATSVDWGDGDRLNEIQATLAGAAGGLIRDIAGAPGAVQGVKNFLNDVTGSGKQWIKDTKFRQFLVAYFAGQAVGTDIVARTTGTVLNPNLELLFQGPRLRIFNFNFKLTPRDVNEANEIRKIVRCLKRNMAPAVSTSNLFLKAPRIFRLEYIHNIPGTDNPLFNEMNQHPFLHKFKPCVLSNFSVDYTPDGSYMTYGENGSMTSYTLTMQFSEIEATYANEYDEKDDDAKDMGF